MPASSSVIRAAPPVIDAVQIYYVSPDGGSDLALEGRNFTVGVSVECVFFHLDGSLSGELLDERSALCGPE